MLKDNMYTTWAEDTSWGFRVISGPYTGVKVRINDVILQDDSSDVKIDCDFLEYPSNVDPGDFNSGPYNELFAKIFNEILKEAIEFHEQQSSRTDDTEESSRE